MSDVWWTKWADQWVRGIDPAVIFKAMVYGHEIDHQKFPGDPMFEKFTDRARRVVVLSQEEARLLRHKYIGTEHLLLGMLHEGEALPAQALEALGIKLDEVRTKVEEIIGEGGEAEITGHIPFTPRAKKVLEFSNREALQLGIGEYIAPEHILLGLIREGGGVAAQVLVHLGADLSTVRNKVIELTSGYTYAKEPPIDISMSHDAAKALHAWVSRLEDLMGPFEAKHPAHMLRSALASGLIERNEAKP